MSKKLSSNDATVGENLSKLAHPNKNDECERKTEISTHTATLMSIERGNQRNISNIINYPFHCYCCI